MERFARIAILYNEFEAQVLQSMLDEREIEYYVKSFYDAAYDGLFQKSQGWGVVFAPRKFEREIMGVIEDIRNSVL